MPPILATLRARLADRRAVAELGAGSWELFSALLFSSAVVPEASATPVPPLVLIASLAVSAAIGPSLAARGARGLWIAAAARAIAWPLSALPLLAGSDASVI